MNVTAPGTGSAHFASPPFEFDINGRISIAAAVADGEEVREFAQRYVAEWLLWYRSGHVGTSVCDVAAFVVTVYGCQFLPYRPAESVLDWIRQTFPLEDLKGALPIRVPEYPEQALSAFRALRPGIRQEGDGVDAVRGEEFLRFALPIESIFVLGGDHRLTVDPLTRLNGYGCRPFPRPEAITFSSSTATSISKYAYDLAEKRRRQFILEVLTDGTAAAANSLSEEIRDGIRRQLEIKPAVAEVVITASGTDSFLIAQGLARLMSDRPVTTLIVGVEESGSGVRLALQQRHFADDAALSDSVHKGQPLSAKQGLARLIDVPVRDGAGVAVPVAVLDVQVRELVTANASAGNHVVLHAMNHSKLGCSGPSRELLGELRQKFGSGLCVVVDACQMRLDREEIMEYLEQQMIVVITGSKYFTGPPFSGAILIPEQKVLAIQASGTKLDAGFNSYCALEDFPPRLQPLLRASVERFNLGSLFRWVAATAEMARYYEIPPMLRTRAVAEFCERAESILRAAPFIELQYRSSSPNASPQVRQGELSGRRMIFPFFLYRGHDGARRVCSEEEVRQVYALLNRDCSRIFPYNNAREFRLLAQMCHIGQPVAAIHGSGTRTAVLRISVGARIFSESFSKATGKMVDALIEDEFWQIGIVLAKIELLLNSSPVR